MATFVDKECPLRSVNAEFVPTPVHAVFLDALWANCPAKKQTFRRRACARGTDTGNAGECKLR
jgi:hypothetical protein